MLLSLTGNLLQGLGDWLLPIVGILAILFLIWIGPKVKNGSAAMKDLIIGLVAFLAIGGIIVFSTTNFKNTSSGTNQAIQKATKNAADQAAKNVDGIISGNGK